MKRLATTCSAFALASAVFACAPLYANADITAEESHADISAVEIAAVDESPAPVETSAIAEPSASAESPVLAKAATPAEGMPSSVSSPVSSENASGEEGVVPVEGASISPMDASTPIDALGGVGNSNQDASSESILTISSTAPPADDDPYKYIYFSIEILDEEDPNTVTMQTGAYAKRLKTDDNGLYVFSWTVDAPTAPAGKVIDEAATASGIYFSADGNSSSKTYASSASYTVSGSSALVTASVVSGNYGYVVITNKYRSVSGSGEQQAGAGGSTSNTPATGGASSAASSTGETDAGTTGASTSNGNSSNNTSGSSESAPTQTNAEPASTQAQESSSSALDTASAVNTGSADYSSVAQGAGDTGYVSYTQDSDDASYDGASGFVSPLSIIVPQAAEAAELTAVSPTAAQTVTEPSETLSEAPNQSQGPQAPMLLAACAAAAVVALGAGAGIVIARRRL